MVHNGDELWFLLACEEFFAQAKETVRKGPWEFKRISKVSHSFKIMCRGEVAVICVVNCVHAVTSKFDRFAQAIAYNHSLVLGPVLNDTQSATA